MIDLGKLVNLEYLFDLRPTISAGGAWTFAIFFIILIAAAIGLKIYDQKKVNEQFEHKIFKNYFNLLLAGGISGLTWLLLRLGEVQLLAARFWLIVWIVLIIWRLALIVKYQYKVVPQAKVAAEQRKLFNKYLPKRKK